MLKTLLQKATYHVRNHFAYYGVCAAVFFGGAVIAAVCAFSLPELNEKELALYFGDFFTNFVQTGADSQAVLLSVLKSNAALFAVLALCSTMVIGAPLIAVVGLCRGFAFGFTAAFLFKTYGLRTLLFLLGAVLPHALITLPCEFVLLAVCLRFSVSLIKDRSDLKKRLLHFTLVLLGLFAVFAAGALLQAYIEPVLLKCFAGYFV